LMATSAGVADASFRNTATRADIFGNIGARVAGTRISTKKTDINPALIDMKYYNNAKQWC